VYLMFTLRLFEPFLVILYLLSLLLS